MSEKGLTTINLKKINRSKVYQYIYKTHQTSKMQIVQDLQMGLSTVSQNLNLLEKEGRIDRNGYFDSTGGRKAQAGFPDFHWNRDPEKHVPYHSNRLIWKCLLYRNHCSSLFQHRRILQTADR